MTFEQKAVLLRQSMQHSDAGCGKADPYGHYVDSEPALRCAANSSSC